MLTIDDMIDRFDGSLGYATNSEEVCQYIADLLKELKERRKADSCEGCVYEGCDCLLCVTCRRICKDKYKPERRTDE